MTSIPTGNAAIGGGLGNLDDLPEGFFEQDAGDDIPDDFGEPDDRENNGGEN
jgi:hypothetical protein